MPAGGPTAASSLYSGIFSSEDPDNTAGPSSVSRTDTSSSVEKEVGSSRNSISSADAKGTSDAAAAPPKSQAWSAALRFAPRKNVNAQANKVRRPPASAIISSSFSAGPNSSESLQKSDATSALPSAATHHAGTSASAKFVSSSSALILTDESARPNEILKKDVQVDALRPLTYNAAEVEMTLPLVTGPPELNVSAEELERDRALFVAMAEKRGEKKGAQQPPWNNEMQVAGEDEEEDINGFGNTREGRRAKRKKHKRKRNTSPGHPGGLAANLRMDADYDITIPNDYNDFKDLVRERREAMRQQRQLREAEEMRKYRSGFDEEDDEEESESDEELDSYRRSRMGRFAPPAIYSVASSNSKLDQDRSCERIFDDDDEKPYLSPPPQPPPTFATPAAAAPDRAMTGEEAYQRRLAMSQGQLQDTNQVATSDATDTDKVDLAAKAAAAAAIAARLTKAAPAHEDLKPSKPISFVSSSFSVAKPQDAASFAERLMQRQGWKEGEALGAVGNKGILDPILAEKKELEHRRRAYDAQKSVQSNRGTIVNAREDERRREERERYGTPSEVILLENMVDVADIDDELNGEIGEECSKHGYVERVFVWPSGPNGVRIFVKFSGMAGAWRCVKELDGRFFGGKTVRASYYPLASYERADYMRIVV